MVAPRAVEGFIPIPLMTCTPAAMLYWKLASEATACSPSREVWNCILRTRSVWTMEVPTLEPMLRMKLLNPETESDLSCGTPKYEAVVAAMKMKPIGQNCMTISRQA